MQDILISLFLGNIYWFFGILYLSNSCAYLHEVFISVGELFSLSNNYFVAFQYAVHFLYCTVGDGVLGLFLLIRSSCTKKTL